jgi:hypothetical protein
VSEGKSSEAIFGGARWGWGKKMTEFANLSRMRGVELRHAGDESESEQNRKRSLTGTSGPGLGAVGKQLHTPSDLHPGWRADDPTRRSACFCSDSTTIVPVLLCGYPPMD